MDERLAIAMRELVQRARAVGITYEEMQRDYQGKPQELDAEIARRTNGVAGLGWAGKMVSYLARRKRMSAAYLAGASLTQLGALYRISPKTVHDLVSKELPADLRLRLAEERTARGRRRSPAWTPTQVSAILGAVSDKDLETLPVTVIAARMVRAANEANENDESDPYLRGESETEATSNLPGQDRRGDGDRPPAVREEGAPESD